MIHTLICPLHFRNIHWSVSFPTIYSYSHNKTYMHAYRTEGTFSCGRAIITLIQLPTVIMDPLRMYRFMNSNNVSAERSGNATKNIRPVKISTPLLQQICQHVHFTFIFINLFHLINKLVSTCLKPYCTCNGCIARVCTLPYNWVVYFTCLHTS